MTMTSTLAAPRETRALTESGHLQAKAPYLLVSLAVLLLDQWSKWLVEMHLGPHAHFEVIPGMLDLIHVQNTGVAFGLFASHGDTFRTLLLLGLGLVALSFVGYYFWLVPKRDRILLSALALVLGGAIGNLIDRLAQGGVTDFIDFYVGTWHWHTFNVADSAISVGIGLMILSAFFDRRPAPDAESLPS
jgi:signal peptidase II